MSHSKGKSTLKHKSTLIKLALLVALLLMIVVFFSMGLQRYLTLEQLRASQSTVEQLLQQNPVVVAAVFFALYVLVTALSLPGAAIMTLAAGAIFGLVQGTLLASFASSIGASLAFLTSRYLLRNPVQKRFSERLLSFYAETGPAFSVFCHQSGDGLDAHTHMDVLLGQPIGHAVRHTGLCKRRHSVGQH